MLLCWEWSWGVGRGNELEPGACFRIGEPACLSPAGATADMPVQLRPIV